MKDIYDEIINYIFSGPMHERKKVEVRKMFKINVTTFRRILIYLTFHSFLYENDTGRKVGLLGKERF